MMLPQIVAKFNLNSDGMPSFSLDKAGRRHFVVIFDIRNAPSEVIAVKYTLHPTYYDPVRTIPRGAGGGFPLKTTTYGDYVIQAELLSSRRSVLLSALVSEALRVDSSEGNKFEEELSLIASN